jgi:hypothetical protein
MARKEQVILGLNGQGVAHEGARVQDQRSGHASGDTVTQEHISPILIALLLAEEVALLTFQGLS